MTIVINEEKVIGMVINYRFILSFSIDGPYFEIELRYQRKNKSLNNSFNGLREWEKKFGERESVKVNFPSV